METFFIYIYIFYFFGNSNSHTKRGIPTSGFTLMFPFHDYNFTAIQSDNDVLDTRLTNRLTPVTKRKKCAGHPANQKPQRH